MEMLSPQSAQMAAAPRRIRHGFSTSLDFRSGNTTMSSHVIEADDCGDEHPDHGSKVNEIQCGPGQDQTQEDQAQQHTAADHGT